MSLSCVPPRMPSPQFEPAPLPSPPPFPRRVSSRSRLHLPATPSEPPIPPRLVGSPLLEKLTHQVPASTASPQAPHQPLWFDGDEFGMRAAASSSPASSSSTSSAYSNSSPSSSPRSTRRAHRRSPSVAYPRRTRSHSPPPPPPAASAAPPPVPPIPSSAFDAPGTRRPVLRAPLPLPAQIVIPDLRSLASVSSSSSSSSGGGYARTRSPRRRGVGFAAYGEEPPRAWRHAEKHFARGRAQRPGTK